MYTSMSWECNVSISDDWLSREHDPEKRDTSNFLKIYNVSLIRIHHVQQISNNPGCWTYRTWINIASNIAESSILPAILLISNIAESAILLTILLAKVLF